MYRKAKKRFDEMLRKDRDKECPLYRSKFWNRDEREREKKKKKTSWFKRGKKKYETVMFVDVTPRSEMAEKFQKVLNEVKLPIKVVEKSGMSLKAMLTRSNPFMSRTCTKPECCVCSRTETANCKTRDCIYELQCQCGIDTLAKHLGVCLNE